MEWGLGGERGGYSEKRRRSVIWIQRKMSLSIALILLVCKITLSTDKAQCRRVRAQREQIGIHHTIQTRLRYRWELFSLKNKLLRICCVPIYRQTKRNNYGLCVYTQPCRSDSALQSRCSFILTCEFPNENKFTSASCFLRKQRAILKRVPDSWLC